MSALVDLLERLNRKERFYLVGWALGNQKFRLGDAFRLQMGEQIGKVIPPDAFVAMDYHLDWIYAALLRSDDPSTLKPLPRNVAILRQRKKMLT